MYKRKPKSSYRLAVLHLEDGVSYSCLLNKGVSGWTIGLPTRHTNGVDSIFDLETKKGDEILVYLGTTFVLQSIFDKPEVSINEELVALQFKIAEDFQIDSNNYEFEGYALPGPQENALLRNQWWVGAVEKDRLTKILSAADKKGLLVDQINSHPLAYRSFANKSSTERAQGVVIVEPNTTTLCFFKGNELLFSKQMDWDIKTLRGNPDKAGLEIQRNLDFFDRRLSSIATQSIVYVGLDAKEVVSTLKQTLQIEIIPYELNPIFSTWLEWSVKENGSSLPAALMAQVLCIIAGDDNE